MDELSTVSSTLLAHKVSEDGDDDVIGEVAGVLDDGVSDQAENTEVLEAVAGQQEGNSGSLDGITKHGLDFVLNSARVIDGFNVLNEGKEFGFGLGVVGVLCKF